MVNNLIFKFVQISPPYIITTNIQPIVGSIISLAVWKVANLSTSHIHSSLYQYSQNLITLIVTVSCSVAQKASDSVRSRQLQDGAWTMTQSTDSWELPM